MVHTTKSCSCRWTSLVYEGSFLHNKVNHWKPADSLPHQQLHKGHNQLTLEQLISKLSCDKLMGRHWYSNDNSEIANTCDTPPYILIFSWSVNATLQKLTNNSTNTCWLWLLHYFTNPLIQLLIWNDKKWDNQFQNIVSNYEILFKITTFAKYVLWFLGLE